MEANGKYELTIKDMIMSFGFLGVVALVSILIWQRGDFFSFLMELFNPANLVKSGLVGLASGLVLTLLLAIIIRLTKTRIPRDGNNELLVELMNKPYGPIVVGVLPGIFEELFFRGFLLAWFLSLWDPVLAITLSTALFWIVHVPQYKTNLVLNGVVIILSVVISILFVEFGTLWAPIVVHTIYNYLITLLVQKGILEV